MKRIIWPIIGALALMVVGYLIWDGYTAGKTNISKKAEDYQVELQKVNENSELTDDKQITERNPYEHKYEDEIADPEDGISYMFTAAKANDVEGFYDSFTSEALYTAFPDPNKMREEMLKYLQLITQNGQLKDIGILDKEITEPDPIHMKVKITVALLYEGLERKKVIIEVQKFQDEHGGQSWTVITPVTHIIEQLKKQ